MELTSKVVYATSHSKKYIIEIRELNGKIAQVYNNKILYHSYQNLKRVVVRIFHRSTGVEVDSCNYWYDDNKRAYECKVGTEIGYVKTYATMEEAKYRRLPKHYTGECILSRSDGSKWKECNYIKGKLHGQYQEWYNSEQLWVSCNYTNGNMNGDYDSWYWNGTKRIHCNYVNGKIEGEYKSWHASGAIDTECNYINGKIHGPFKRWFNNTTIYNEHYYTDEQGNVVKEPNFVDNKSKIFIECDYVNGNRQGEYKQWYPNGRIHILCNYLNVKRHGQYNSWYPNGHKSKDITYENGLRKGKATMWWKDWNKEFIEDVRYY